MKKRNIGNSFIKEGITKKIILKIIYVIVYMSVLYNILFLINTTITNTIMTIIDLKLNLFFIFITHQIIADKKKYIQFVLWSR